MEHITHVFNTAGIDVCHINEIHVAIIIADIFKHMARVFISIGSISIAPPKNTLSSWIIPSISWNLRICGGNYCSGGAGRRSRISTLKGSNYAAGRAEAYNCILEVLAWNKDGGSGDVISDRRNKNLLCISTGREIWTRLDAKF